ncbi:hypothetical protein G6L32_14615 [Agrobacterium tumefaciens]|uniref:hypothetical protein n=1 Tax=Agrobacterium tumefaciens TaxID=358 RepID=UPI0015737526|nr:hypothetical protein [Agrobacterium tumefaciens]
MGGNVLHALKIIAIGNSFTTTFPEVSINGEEFCIIAGFPALNVTTVHALPGGVNAAAKFQICEPAPVWFCQRRTAVEQL